MRYFEDITIGDTFRSPAPYRVTEVELKDFAAKWDPQRYHLDEAEAARLVGRLFAPAVLTLCIGFRLSHQSGYFEMAAAAGLGLEDIKIVKPVFIDDELSVRITVSGKRESRSRADTGIITHRTEVVNQSGEVVLSYTIPTLVYKRSA